MSGPPAFMPPQGYGYPGQQVGLSLCDVPAYSRAYRGRRSSGISQDSSSKVRQLR